MEVLPTFYTFACFSSLRLQVRLRLQSRGKKGESVKLREEEMQTEFVASRKEGISERGSFARSFNPKMHCAFDVYLRYDRYRLYRI